MYVINVARKRDRAIPPWHVFRTAPDSITNKDHAIAVAKDLRKIYPRETHSVDISYHVHAVEYIHWED